MTVIKISCLYSGQINILDSGEAGGGGGEYKFIVLFKHKVTCLVNSASGFTYDLINLVSP